VVAVVFGGALTLAMLGVFGYAMGEASESRRSLPL
jgi:hypothetical protein